MDEVRWLRFPILELLRSRTQAFFANGGTLGQPPHTRPAALRLGKMGRIARRRLGKGYHATQNYCNLPYCREQKSALR